MVSIFFDRNETASHVVIKISPWWLYVSLGLIAVMLVPRIGQDAAAPSGIVSTLALWALIIVSIWRLLKMRGVRGEIFRAMKEGSVQMSGSRFNPTSPMTIKIQKKNVEISAGQDAG
ncbi:MAG: hypothetical protein ACI9DC_002329 [Gammaproteobacteria bacterium]